MKILSIDTASDVCGVSILENTNLICKLDTNTGRTHSENLMPMISQAFQQSNLTLKDIDLLVCDKGPGSFTGIRIGVATVKAFHDSMEIPCTGVSSLEALTYSVKNDGLIASILDCKNDNCYFALYELKNSNYIKIVSPIADSYINILEICKKYVELKSSPITFIGDGAEIYKDTICEHFKNANFVPQQDNILNSYNLGLAGFKQMEENRLEDVLPLYLRKPQAQRQLEEKFKDIEILPMTIESLNNASEFYINDFDEFWNLNVLKDELQSENSKYIMAKFNNQIIGFAGIKVMVNEADIMNIAVKKDFRNQGIGTILLKNLIDLSKELKLCSINLEVNEENYPAIHLYKNLGFEQIGTRKNYYKDKNAILMLKKL